MEMEYRSMLHKQPAYLSSLDDIVYHASIIDKGNPYMVVNDNKSYEEGIKALWKRA